MGDDIKPGELSKVFEKVGKAQFKLPKIDGDKLRQQDIFLDMIKESSYQLNNLKPPHNPTYDLIDKQEEANDLLNKIVENTSVLKEIVEINRQTQLSTEELNEVLKEIHAVAKAENKDEADGLFKKALNKINTSGETVGNIANLVSLLMGIYSTVQPLINK